MPLNSASLKREGPASFAWAVLAHIDFFTLQGLVAWGKAAAGMRWVRSGESKQMKFSCCSKSIALRSWSWKRWRKTSSCP